MRPQPSSSNRDRLLACIPGALAVTEEAREAIALLVNPPRNTVEQDFEFEATEVTELNFLEESGVPVQDPANTALRNARDAVSPLLIGMRGAPPSKQQVARVIKPLRVLLSQLQMRKASLEQSWFGWETLLQACEAIALSNVASKTTRQFIESAVLAGLQSQGPDWDSNYDEHGSYGGPAPHVPAATSAMYLYSQSPTVGAERAVNLASVDPFRPARAMVAYLLPRLRPNNQLLMWALADRFAEDESPGVVQQFVANSLGYLLRIDCDRGMLMLASVYERSLGQPGQWSGVRTSCRALFLWQSLLGHPSASSVVEQLLENRNRDPDQIRRLMFDLRRYSRSSNFEVRSAAMKTLHNWASRFVRDYTEYLPPPAGSPPEIDIGPSIGKNLVEIASELFFASGAFARDDSKPRNPSEDDLAFFEAAMPTLMTLQNVGIPAVVHRLCELLEYFIDARPSTVFELVVALIRAGATQGYQYEPMGAEKTVGIMEHFMSEHRNIIESSAAARSGLLESLNVFSSWPNAVRLVYRFEEVFR